LDSADQLPSQFVLLRDAAVSTSGDAEQFVKLGGKRYSHIVDPRTGMAVVGRSSVTVIAPKGITADALATAASVLGPQRGLKLIEDTEGAAAYIVVATDSGTAAFESSRFAYVPHGRPKHAQSPPQLKGQ
jgi:thiamine biosynthesis lipoprotein